MKTNPVTYTVTLSFLDMDSKTFNPLMDAFFFPRREATFLHSTLLELFRDAPIDQCYKLIIKMPEPKDTWHSPALHVYDPRTSRFLHKVYMPWLGHQIAMELE